MRMSRLGALAAPTNKDNWVFNGTAKRKVVNEFQIVPNLTNQVGDAWYIRRLAIPFTIDFSFNCTPSTGPNFGDGITLMITDASTPLTAIGDSGGKLGIVGSGYRIQGVAIDTWKNPGTAGGGTPFVRPFIGTFDSNTLTTTGDIGYPAYTTYTDLTNAQIDGYHTVNINVTSTTVTAKLDGSTVLTSNDLSGILPTGNIRIGFSGATGGSTANWVITYLGLS
jgi:hypothetical protein